MSMRHMLMVMLSVLLFVPFTATAAETDESSHLRDPFWPVSYNAPAPQTSTGNGEAGTVAAPTLRWPELPIRGISRGPDGSFFALIENIGVVRTGEVVSVFKDNLWFHWHIAGIEAKGLRTIKLGTSRDKNNIPQLKQDQTGTETQP